VTRDKPSTKARIKSYEHMRKLFDMLDKLVGYSPYRAYDEMNPDIDFKGWKEWANKHTPPDKRGGPTNPYRKRNS
jgi:hypothetical protein